MKPIYTTYLTLSFVLLISFKGYSQDATANTLSNEQKQVMKPIHQLFDTFISRDSSAARELFVSNALLYSMTPNGVKYDGVGGFLNFIGNSGRPPVSEPIWSPKILIEDNLAMVWVSYAFLIEENLSHCGVDLFQLMFIEDEWKIISVIDTRRKENCEVGK